MSRRIVIIIGISVIALVVLAAIIILGGTPGGPIIVIQPEPPPYVDGAEFQTGFSHWSFGCEKTGLMKAEGQDMDGITWRWAEWAGVEVIEVNGSPVNKVKLLIGNTWVEIEYVKDHVPIWRVGDDPNNPDKLEKWDGKLFTTTPHWPNRLIGVISAASIDGAPMQVDQIKKIAIRYNKHALYKDCP